MHLKLCDGPLCCILHKSVLESHSENPNFYYRFYTIIIDAFRGVQLFPNTLYLIVSLGAIMAHDFMEIYYEPNFICSNKRRL